MENQAENKEFCMRQFKPIVGVILLLLVGVVIWTIYHEIHTPATVDPIAHAQVHHGGNLQQAAATAPNMVIHIGDTVPHGNKYGNDCLMCHTVAGGDQKAPIPAPPIAMTTPMPHPFWGACDKCHKILGAGSPAAAPVAFINTMVGSNIVGADMMTLTPGLAKQYNLPTQSGVLVNSIEKGSYAEKLGFVEGDIITAIDKQTITDVSQISAYLSGKKDGTKIRVEVIRNKTRTKNIKFKLTAANLFDPGNANKIAILASGGNLNALVAYSMDNAPYLIIYNLKDDTFHSIPNPYRGMPDNKISNWVLSQKVGTVLVGNINDLDLQNLNNSSVSVYSGVFGTVTDSVNLYKQGSLQKSLPVQQQVAFTTNSINSLAIAANYPDPSANISQSFEASQYFIVVELDQNKYEVIQNRNFNVPGTNGTQMAQLLMDNKVDAVVTNQIGTAATSELKNLNIHLYKNVNMGVGDAVVAFRNNKIQPEF